MHDDPWANDPYGTDDEPVDDPWGEPEDDDPWAVTDAYTNQTDEDDSEENSVQDTTTVSTTNGSEISVTLKQHGGFDSPWIVIRATTAEDAKKQLQAIVSGDLTKATAWAAEQFAATKPNNTPQSAPARPAVQPAPAQGGGGGDGRSCQHGQMVYRTGTNKFGKPYEAYFCPTPKGTPGQCKAQFV